jgi:hypothetical protein
MRFPKLNKWGCAACQATPSAQSRGAPAGGGYNTPRKPDVSGLAGIFQITPVHVLQVPHPGSKNNSTVLLYHAFPGSNSA